jgi:nitrogen fixation/metabolism regulation signal transduction histidine kinase
MENQTNAPSNRRRQYYINKKFQGNFIVQFSAFLILGCMAFGLAVYVYSAQTLTTAFVDSKLRVMSTAHFLLPALILIALVVTAFLAVAAAIRLLLFSHKIAGPLYRLEKTAEAITSGKLDFQVKLRSGDELQAFAHTMDEMVKELRARATEIRDHNQKLRKVIQEVKNTPSIPKDLLRSLEETQSQLEQAVSRFQV